jgi:hypothetical protein
MAKSYSWSFHPTNTERGIPKHLVCDPAYLQTPRDETAVFKTPTTDHFSDAWRNDLKLAHAYTSG